MSKWKDIPYAEIQYLKLTLPRGGFRLTSGKYLKEIQIAYEAFGELAKDGKNAIFVCHTLTGDSHVAGYYGADDAQPGWWDPLIGPGKAIDTNKYYVICPNILGGCKGTTGPLSTDPDTGKPYGAEFPLIEMSDVIRVQKLFLDQLGIPELYGVVGGSLGGMQALGWALQYPAYVKRCICIAAGASLSPQALAFDIIARQEIENDPHFNTGKYHEQKQIPERGLSIARQIGHVTYLSSRSMAMKFGRGEWPVKKNMKRGKFGTHFQVESYLHHQGEKFVKRFDANSYLYLTRLMDTFDLAKGKESLAQALEKVESRFLVVSISTDWLFPSKQQQELVSALMENRKQVSYFMLDSPYGHDAFLIEYDGLGRGVDAFLNGACPEKADLKGTRRDVDEVSRMIGKGDYVLDVGSGDGAFSASLKKTKKITSVCLDVDFDAVVACMSKGLSALQLDADTGLEMIGDKAFDCVLLNQTIQQLNSALTTMKHMLRVAPVAVIGFPNFAYYKYRISVGLKGRLPVSKTLPYEWYETPNIHVVTLKDFRSLCRNNGYTIEDIVFLADDPIGKRMIRMGLVDLGSERVLAKLSKS